MNTIRSFLNVTVAITLSLVAVACGTTATPHNIQTASSVEILIPQSESTPVEIDITACNRDKSQPWMISGYPEKGQFSDEQEAVATMIAETKGAAQRISVMQVCPAPDNLEAPSVRPFNSDTFASNK